MLRESGQNAGKKNWGAVCLGVAWTYGDIAWKKNNVEIGEPKRKSHESCAKEK